MVASRLATAAGATCNRSPDDSCQHTYMCILFIHKTANVAEWSTFVPMISYERCPPIRIQIKQKKMVRGSRTSLYCAVKACPQIPLEESVMPDIDALSFLLMTVFFGGGVRLVTS